MLNQNNKHVNNVWRNTHTEVNKNVQYLLNKNSISENVSFSI